MAECPAVGKLVRALYTFKGSNNDELCFRKGDVITITQSVEGGWWEGTLNGKTGWFPSNYVTESSSQATTTTDVKPVTCPKPPSMVDIKRTSVLHYHQMVVQSLVETERVYVTELQQLIQSYLHPIHTAQYLNQLQYSHLVGNIDELVTFHTDSLNKLEACGTLPHLQQRVGGLFLKMAPQLKQLYEGYFSNHPWAVQVMLSKKDDLNTFMESKGIPSPGTMELTTCLSKPFARLEQYSSTLKELERHIEDCHPDRGDTQRALAVCKDMQTGCIELRKQKEVECEIMSGTIDGCHAEVTSSLGSLVYLGNVMLMNEAGEKKHSVLALFQHQVLFLYISSCMSGYEYQGCLPSTTVTVNVLEDSDTYKHAFELSSGKEKKSVVCTNAADRKRWIDLLSQHTATSHNNTAPIVAPGPVVGGGSIAVPSPAAVPPKPSAQVEAPKPVLSPKPVKQQTTDTVTAVAHNNNNQPNGRVWSMSCLRPSAPLRPTFYNKDGGGQQSPRTIRKTYSQRRKAERTRSEDGYAMKRIEDMKTLEEDAVILQVIEAYCTSSRTRHTVNSSMLLDNPQMMIVEEEKMIVDGMAETVEEKSLVDTVYVLHDQMCEMKRAHDKLRHDLTTEVKTRRQLERFLKKRFRSLSALDTEQS